MSDSTVTLRAVQWWRRKAPASYTVAMHLKEPLIGCKGPEEIHLAQAVAEYVRAQDRNVEIK